MKIEKKMAKINKSKCAMAAQPIALGAKRGALRVK
jgi:hypothetical protein